MGVIPKFCKITFDGIIPAIAITQHEKVSVSQRATGTSKYFFRSESELSPITVIGGNAKFQLDASEKKNTCIYRIFPGYYNY